MWPLPPHWRSPLIAAIACVVCGAIVEVSATLSPLARLESNPRLRAGSWALQYASVAAESSLLVALTLIGGLVLLLRRVRTEEARLRLALLVTTLGFLVALSVLLSGLYLLFVGPAARGQLL